jgi:energy-coupling factor transport system substrate-specific component
MNAQLLRSSTGHRLAGLKRIIMRRIIRPGMWKAALKEMCSRNGLKVAIATMIIYSLLPIPFKQFVIIDLITEVRPAGAIPVVMAVLFGPGAAIGAAFGNLIGDAFGGMLTASSVFGFIGNFAYALTAWAVWMELRRGLQGRFDLRAGAHFIVAAVTASAVCAFIIAAGVDLLGMAPFTFLFGVIILNNITWSCTFGLLLAFLWCRYARSRGPAPPVTSVP